MILGIETSCDETAVAIAIKHGQQVKIISNLVSSQIKIHQKYGGVVPEVAARQHVLNILPVIDECLKQAGLNRKTAPKKIKAIAVTTGPGLITSLMVGLETAKTLAYAWQKPIISVNHIAGHIYANFIDQTKTNIFPAVILTASGGHNLLVLMTSHLHYKVLGETRDDASGEAFDKASKLLGLGYPGGPIIAKRASQAKKNSSNIKLPRPMINDANFDFSFSGLKTALLYSLQKNPNWQKQINEYCAEFQQAVVDVLISKTIKASKKYSAKTIMLAGGVSANLELRKQLTEQIKIKLPKTNFLIPDLKYTTDNAAMIASAGAFKFSAKQFTPWNKLKVDPNLKLT